MTGCVARIPVCDHLLGFGRALVKPIAADHLFDLRPAPLPDQPAPSTMETMRDELASGG